MLNLGGPQPLAGGLVLDRRQLRHARDRDISDSIDPRRELEDDTLAQLAIVDDRWNILSVNSAWRRAAGFGASAMRLAPGTNLEPYFRESKELDPSGAEVMLRGIRAIDSGATSQFLGSYDAAADRSSFQVSISAFDVGGHRYAAVSRTNVTELAHLRTKARSLGDSLIDAQTDLADARAMERERVARALHDTAARHLVGVNLGLARLVAASSDPCAIAVAREIGDLLGRFDADIRDVGYVLRPPELRSRGLHDAVRAQCDTLAERSGLDVGCRILGHDRRRGMAAETAIFRVVQGAIANIERHARARHVGLRLESRKDACLVVIKDDGIGLPQGWTARPAPGVGVAAMARRIIELGGRFDIRSVRGGSGTIVAAAVPV